MKKVEALLTNDLRNIRRDPVLLMIVLLPWFFVLLLRYAIPSLSKWAMVSFGLDLTPYYPMFVGFFFMLEVPILFGLVFGFSLLEERDDGTLAALQVTPVSLSGYATYRVVLSLALSILYLIIAIPLSGLLKGEELLRAMAHALPAAVLAPFVSLGLAKQAGNRIEGLALMKAFGGVFMVVPVAVVLFFNGIWQYAAGVIPSFWFVKGLWLSANGQVGAVHTGVGVLYTAALLTTLLGWFSRRPMVAPVDVAQTAGE